MAGINLNTNQVKHTKYIQCICNVLITKTEMNITLLHMYLAGIRGLTGITFCK
jgi:hypothetical protein